MITAWLAANGHNRQWLADQLGSTLNTVNKWFSSGFPKHAMLNIERIMNPSGDRSAGLHVSFDAPGWEKIQKATRLAGFATTRDFYQTVISQAADAILAREKQLGIPDEEPALVAEQGAQYGPKGGENRKGGAQDGEE